MKMASFMAALLSSEQHHRGEPGTFQSLFFRLDLNAVDPCGASYTELQNAYPDVFGKHLQIAFGGDGLLYGHAGSGDNVINDLFVIFISSGLRVLFLDDIDGGSFTDMASFNPLCDCPRCVVDDDDNDGVCEDDDDDDDDHF